jgi:hypothetical protein
MNRLGARYDGRGRRAVTGVKLRRASVRRPRLAADATAPHVKPPPGPKATIWQSY